MKRVINLISAIGIAILACIMAGNAGHAILSMDLSQAKLIDWVMLLVAGCIFMPAAVQLFKKANQD